MEDSEVRVLDVADPKKQESLQSENEPDPMDAEQTWPTEEELAQAQGLFSVVHLGAFRSVEVFNLPQNSPSKSV